MKIGSQTGISHRRTTIARVVMVACGLIATATGAAQNAGVALEGEALRREVSGSTIAGFHLSTQMRFSEFHSPDGRIFGHNGGTPVDKGCWDVRGDEVCYYYSGDYEPRGVWCWTFHRLAVADQYRLALRDRGTLALGIRIPGNPENWSDNGKPWECNGLTSKLKQSLRPAALMQRR